MLHILQTYHLVGQEFERPALVSIWSIATRKVDQLRLAFAVQAPPFGAFAREASGEGHLQVLLDKPLFDANHGAATDGERPGNLSIGMTGFALTLIAHQQHSCHQIGLGWSGTSMHHGLQKPSLFLTQSHRKPVVRGFHW